MRTFVTISLFFFFSCNRAIHFVNWSIQLSNCHLPHLFSMLQAVMRAGEDHCPCPTTQDWCGCAYNRVILNLDFLSVQVIPAQLCNMHVMSLQTRYFTTFVVHFLYCCCRKHCQQCIMSVDNFYIQGRFFCLYFFLSYSSCKSPNSFHIC